MSPSWGTLAAMWGPIQAFYLPPHNYRARVYDTLSAIEEPKKTVPGPRRGTCTYSEGASGRAGEGYDIEPVEPRMKKTRLQCVRPRPLLVPTVYTRCCSSKVGACCK